MPERRERQSRWETRVHMSVLPSELLTLLLLLHLDLLQPLAPRLNLPLLLLLCIHPDEKVRLLGALRACAAQPGKKQESAEQARAH